MKTSSTAGSSTLRQYYRPVPDRVPAWLRRVWNWL